MFAIGNFSNSRAQIFSQFRKLILIFPRAHRNRESVPLVIESNVSGSRHKWLQFAFLFVLQFFVVFVIEF